MRSFRAKWSDYLEDILEVIIHENFSAEDTLEWFGSHRYTKTLPKRWRFYLQKGISLTPRQFEQLLKDFSSLTNGVQKSL